MWVLHAEDSTIKGNANEISLKVIQFNNMGGKGYAYNVRDLSVKVLRWCSLKEKPSLIRSWQQTVATAEWFEWCLWPIRHEKTSEKQRFGQECVGGTRESGQSNKHNSMDVCVCTYTDMCATYLLVGGR